MQEMDRDRQYMQMAIAAARDNLRSPFGAVLVDPERQQVVASGVNRVTENPTWHGEIDVINRYAAAEVLPEGHSRSPIAAVRDSADWSRLHLYTTAEPCPMCQSAILWAGIPRVVYGTSVERLKELGWNQIDIRAQEVVERAAFGQCQLMGGVLEAECDALFRLAR